MNRVNVNHLMLTAVLCTALFLPSGMAQEAGWITEIEDGFEGEFPGPWQRSAQSGDYTWGPMDYESVEGTEGTRSLWCAGRNLNDAPRLFPGGNYANNMDAWVTFGPMDTRYCTEGFFRYSIWHRMSVNDYVEVLASTGQGWNGVRFTGSSLEWKQFEYDLADFPNVGNLLDQQNVYIAFRFVSDAGGVSTGAFIDSVVIKKNFSGWPDLAAQNISHSPQSQIQSKRVDITVDATNLSQHRTYQTECAFFVSKDDQFDASDLILDVVMVAPLNAGQTQKCISLADVPLALPPGDYYVGAIIDPANELIESDKGNNMVISETASLNIAADIGWETVIHESFEDIDFPGGVWQSIALAGTDYGWGVQDYTGFHGLQSLWCTGRTVGNAPSTRPETGYANNARSVAVFGPFSLDECIRGDLSFAVWRDLSYHTDAFKVKANFGGTMDGYSFTTSTYGWQYYQFDLTNWVGIGNMVGVNNIFIRLEFESDAEGAATGVFVDNFMIRKKLARPDLIVTEVSASPDRTPQGGAIAVNAKVKNRERVESDTTKVAYYLSKDQVISQDDEMLGEDDLFILQPDEEIAFEKNFDLPGDLDVGDYYVLVVVDGDDRVPETVESNNTGMSASPVAVYQPMPDLVPTILSASPDQITAGEFVQISIQVKNEGEVNADPAKALYVLSTDQDFSTSDTQLGVHETAALAPNEMATYEKSFQIPADLAAGSYYLGVIVDPDDTVQESNETNNTAGIDEAIRVNTTSVQETGAIPTEFSLNQNYPNPFNPVTEIQFSLPGASHVRLVVMNMQGRLIRVLGDQSMEAGVHHLTWDGTNAMGDKVASGVYIYQLHTETFLAQRKMMLMQ